MKRLIAILVLAAAIIGAVFMTAAKSPGQPVATYKIEFDNIFGLTEGGDLTIAGVKAGKTPGPFELTNDERPKALVTAEIAKPGFTPFRADAHCDIRQQNLIGTYYVSCQPGKSPRKLPNGATIPVEQTASTIPPDLMLDVMRRPYKERFRIILAELGTGLAGRPEDIQEVLRRAHPGLRETNKTLRVLGDQNQTIKRLITDGDTVVRELEANKEDVARFVREAGETAEIAATREADIRRGLRLLPGFLRELRPTMARLGELSDNSISTLRELRESAPELHRFLVEAEPFARETRPALRDLGRTSLEGIEAINASDEEIRQLRALAEPLPPRGDQPAEQGAARPLRQLLVSLDQRNRSIEEDRRAAPRSRFAQGTGPPDYDPTAWRPGEGFTGFEAALNFFYWQALGINIFDDVSHYLRVLVVADPECARYTTDPTAAQKARCSAYMGNYQPCISGYRQPTGSIFNRREICAGRTHGGESSGADAPPRDKRPKTGQPEVTASQAPRAAASRAGSPSPRPRRPDASVLDPANRRAASAPANAPADKDLQLMDYFLGNGK